MQYVHCLVAIGGDQANKVPRYNVSAAELPVLQAIHGEDAISEVEPAEGPRDADGKPVEVDEREELQRIREQYAGAHNEDREAFVDLVYPRAAGTRIVTSVKALGLPKEAMKTKSRVSIDEPVADTRPPPAPGTDTDTVRRKGRARTGDVDLVSESPGTLVNRVDTSDLGNPDLKQEDVLK